MRGLSERDVERVLREHRQMHDPATGGSSCECGGWIGPFTLLPVGDDRSHAAHVADALAPVLAAIRAEAKAEALAPLRALADEFRREADKADKRSDGVSYARRTAWDRAADRLFALLDGGDQS